MKQIQLPAVIWFYGFVTVICALVYLNLDLEVSDAYVFGNHLLSAIIATLFGLFAIITFVVHFLTKSLSPWLHWLHFGSSLFFALAFVVLNNIDFIQPNTLPLSNLVGAVGMRLTNEMLNDFSGYLLFFFAFSQLILLINIFRAVLVYWTE
jgi:hypothetical protein